MELAFNLTKTKGIATEADLPYTGSDGSCPQYTPAVVAGGYVKNPCGATGTRSHALPPS